MTKGSKTRKAERTRTEKEESSGFNKKERGGEMKCGGRRKKERKGRGGKRKTKI
jgi:hypothetical protein